MAQVNMRCTGDTISGDGKKQVLLSPNGLTQEPGLTCTDELRFTLDSSHPDFSRFVKDKDAIYIVSL